VATGIAATSALAGSDFLRLLAAWGWPRLPPPRGFGQRLSEWFSWTDAIALSGALGGPAEPVPAGLLTAAERLAVETRELARVRQQLLGHIRGEPAGARSRPAARVAVSPRVQARLAAEHLGDEGFAPTASAAWPCTRPWTTPSARCASACATRWPRPRPRWPTWPRWTW
jgi:hypothetical protein